MGTSSRWRNRRRTAAGQPALPERASAAFASLRSSSSGFAYPVDGGSRRRTRNSPAVSSRGALVWVNQMRRGCF
jgi:hypothetical protein